MWSDRWKLLGARGEITNLLRVDDVPLDGFVDGSKVWVSNNPNNMYDISHL